MTLQPTLVLSVLSPHSEKYMEFDLNGNGDIGEKRVNGGVCGPRQMEVSFLFALSLVDGRGPTYQRWMSNGNVEV
jgi:hypothetical protein